MIVATNTPIEEYVRRLNCGQRIDCAIQESPVEAANEWLAAVSSHFQYWRHKDVISFIIDRLICMTEEEKAHSFDIRLNVHNTYIASKLHWMNKCVFVLIN